MVNDLMRKAKDLAKGSMFILHQFGVEYSMNEHGGGPRVGCGPCPEESTPWREAKEWMEAEVTSEGRHLCRVSGEECVIRGVDGYVVFYFLLERLAMPTQEDYEAYARWYGVSSYEEAQYEYGDMEWPRERLWVSVEGGDMKQFLQHVAPLCWG